MSHSHVMEDSDPRNIPGIRLEGSCVAMYIPTSSQQTTLGPDFLNTLLDDILTKRVPSSVSPGLSHGVRRSARLFITNCLFATSLCTAGRAHSPTDY